jgi:hypothetical protein
MKEVSPEVSIDILLMEFLSYQLYRRKKEPLEGIDAKKRLRDGSWKEEGVDIDVLERKGRIPREVDIPKCLFEVEQMRVRSGLLGFRSEHRVLKGLRPVSEIIGQAEREAVSAKKVPSDDLRNLMRSKLLFPLFLQAGATDRLSIFKGLTGDTAPQTYPGDISPEAALRRFVDVTKTDIPEDDALEAVFKPFKGPLKLQLGDRSDHRDLASALFSLFELSDEGLTAAIGSGELQRVSRDLLHSPYLEALFEDLAVGPDGTPEVPEVFRARLGRVLLESGEAERFHQRFVQPSLSRLLTCSKGESERLGSILPPLMDNRSTPVLLDLLFKVPQGNRPAVLGLIGATRDKSASEPLRRMLEYSNVDEDRRSAQKALERIGVDH